jgi:type I restriction enzyme S subunit
VSQLKALITEQCPNGVSFESLGTVAEVRSGWGFPNSEQGSTDGDFPFYKVSDMTTPGNGVQMRHAKNYVSHEAARRLRVKPAPPGTVIFPKIGAAVATNKKRLLSVESAYDNNVMGVIPSSRLLPEFLFQYMNSVDLSRLANYSGAVPSIRKADVERLRIPVPPRDVQQEVVRILNQFTALDQALEAEIEGRKRQRNALTRVLPSSPRISELSPNGVELVRIGEVASQFVEPVRVRADETYVNLGVRWYGEGAFARESKKGSAIKGTTLYKVKAGHFIYNRMFVVEGSFGVITPELAGGVVSNEFPVYELDTSRVLPEWLVLYLLDEYTLKRVAAEVTGVERGSMKSRRRWKEAQFEAFQIELPSVTAQQEILRILGTGVALESSLRDERAARRRQYEHYRNKLLTFEEAVA